VRGLLKGMALSVPPVRRLYQALDRANQVNEEQRGRIVALEHELAETTEYMHRARRELAKTGDIVWKERMRADELKAKHEAAENDRQALELQLYVLRSDLQRAATRNEALVHEVRRFESDVAQREKDAASLATLAQEAAAAAAGRVTDGLRPLIEQINQHLSR